MASNAFTQAGGGPGGGNGFIYLQFSAPDQRDYGVRLAKWSVAASDMSEALAWIGENILLRDFRLQFEAEGGYLGSQIGPKWQQLAPATQAERARLGFGADHPILQRTGELMASVTQRGASGNIFQVGPTSISVGTSLRKALWHQYGTGKRTGRQWDYKQQRHREMTTYGMPPRKMIGLRYASRMEITAYLRTWLNEKARESGIGLYGAGWASGANG